MSEHINIVGDVVEQKRNKVVLKFHRDNLLYDIKNYAYVESDVMSEDAQHNRHVLAEIGEAGNVDRVYRILSVVHAAVIEMLYPYTKKLPVDEEIDNSLIAPETYEIEMQVPDTMSRSTLHLLSRLIHEYMVYSVLADWLDITNPQAAANWREKAEITSSEINRTKSNRAAFVRPLRPF